MKVCTSLLASFLFLNAADAVFKPEGHHLRGLTGGKQPPVPPVPSPFEPDDADDGERRETLFRRLTTCSFDTSSVPGVMKLLGDCTTDGTITVPDATTLDGDGFTITAVDPTGGNFLGAVVANGGTTAGVENLKIETSGLASVCQSGANRLAGIKFAGASGSIKHNTIIAVNKGASGCQEGSGIEVRNPPFDGTHPNTMVVDIDQNSISAYQKTGILANGDIDVVIHRNTLSASATELNLAPNTIQAGYGAIASVRHNTLDGNQWLGDTNWVATGILLVYDGSYHVHHNTIGGNSDVGLFDLSYEASNVHDNVVKDMGADYVEPEPNSDHHYDIGIYVYPGPNGEYGEYFRNEVCGFDYHWYPDPLPGDQNSFEANCDDSAVGPYSENAKCPYQSDKRLFRITGQTLTSCEQKCVDSANCVLYSWRDDGLCMGCVAGSDLQPHDGFTTYALVQSDEGFPELLVEGEKCPYKNNANPRLFTDNTGLDEEECNAKCDLDPDCHFWSRGLHNRRVYCMGCKFMEPLTTHAPFNTYYVERGA